jgi:ABC-type sugar transport system substrate-binding protein
LTLVAAFVVVAGLAIAACGSSSSSSSSSSSGGEGGESTSSESSSIKPATIALMDFSAGSPVDLACDEVVKAAAAKFGWKVLYTDANAEPEKASAAISAAVTQGVDAIITTSGEASYYRPPLLRAQQKGIPAIAIGGAEPDPLFTAAYVEPKPPIAEALNKYILEQNPKAQIGAIQAAVVKAGTVRYEQLVKQTKGTEAKIVATVEPNIADISSYEKSIADMLTANPEIDTVWSVFDQYAQAATAAIRSTGSEAKLYSFYVSPSNLELLDKPSPLEAVADNELPVTGAIAMSELLYNIQEGREINPNYMEENPLKVKIYTRKNVAEAGTVWSPEKILAPFAAEWEKSFPGALQ